MLVARFAQDAELLQAAPSLGAALAVLFRQAVAQRAVGEAQLEVADHLRMREAAAFADTSALPGFASVSRGSNRPPGATRADRRR